MWLFPLWLFLDRVRGVWGLLGRLYGRDPRCEGGDDAPILPVSLFERPNTVLKFGYQEVRTVAGLVGGRTRLVAGCTAACCGVEQDVDSPGFPFYRKCAPAYTAAHGLGADAEYLGGLAYGRTAYWLRTVLSHAPIVRYQKTPRKALEDDLAPLKRSWNL